MVTGSIVAGSALAGAAFGASEKKKAGKKAKKLTRKQEEFERFELADSLRLSLIHISEPTRPY